MSLQLKESNTNSKGNENISKEKKIIKLTYFHKKGRVYLHRIIINFLMKVKY